MKSLRRHLQDPARRERIGRLLVALQLGLIGALALLAWRGLHHRPASPLGAFMAALGIALGLWAVWANRPGNFNIRPTPRAGARLVTHGPYRWIRHPMYSAVFACALAAALISGRVPAWMACAALVLVLGVKAALEERWMMQTHADYAEYRARTRRFIPGIY